MTLRGTSAYENSYANKQRGKASTNARKAYRNEIEDAMDAPVIHRSFGDRTTQPLAAPVPTEADFLYSYDASSSPQGGKDVLSFAINQAVRRFENNETEKLVNKEYDIIDDIKDEFTASEEEDDFEMIDIAHLK
jgi:hypothetical protein